MSKKDRSITVEGTKYGSPSLAARALVAAGKSIAETAKLTGITYQTVFSVTVGAAKVAARRVNYKIINLGKRGKNSVGEISKTCGVSSGKVLAILKKAGVATLNADQVKAMRKTLDDAKAAKVVAKPAKTPKTTKAAKTPKAPKVAKTPEVTPELVATAPESIVAV